MRRAKAFVPRLPLWESHTRDSVAPACFLTNPQLFYGRVTQHHNRNNCVGSTTTVQLSVVLHLSFAVRRVLRRSLVLSPAVRHAAAQSHISSCIRSRGSKCTSSSRQRPMGQQPRSTRCAAFSGGATRCSSKVRRGGRCCCCSRRMHWQRMPSLCLYARTPLLPPRCTPGARHLLYTMAAVPAFTPHRTAHTHPACRHHQQHDACMRRAVQPAPAAAAPAAAVMWWACGRGPPRTVMRRGPGHHTCPRRGSRRSSSRPAARTSPSTPPRRRSSGLPSCQSSKRRCPRGQTCLVCAWEARCVCSAPC